MQDLYNRLAVHLEHLTMGYPYTEELLDLLKEMFSPSEAQVALAIPNDLEPLQVVSMENISARADLPLPEVAEALESMAGRNIQEPILFTGGVAVIPQMDRAFARSLEHPIQVAPDPQMTGALGAALLAKERYLDTA